VTAQLEKVDPNASTGEMRKYGTLGVLRHPFKDRGVTIKLCQFKPDHGLNPDTLAAYASNRLRVVPELNYSPYAKYPAKGEKSVSKNWRIDLVLFVNGIPVATLELKSEFKQAANNAVRQYCRDRLPKDPATGKPEPLLTFKRGALVHFAVSQYDVQMCTRLAGSESLFLPFNRGTEGGGAGNDVPKDGSHPTSYLWREILQRDHFLGIIGRFVHLQIEEKEDWQWKRVKKETLIFPRYHQWDLVRALVSASLEEGPGHEYFGQHSAGSGKSNSIADEAHSSQTGTSARKLREVLMAEQIEDEKEMSAEDMVALALEARRGSKNLSYYAFTATPKPRTLELFGRVPNPALPSGKDNLPEAFHVYSMRQAIEEGFILDVLRNYISYGTAYKIAFDKYITRLGYKDLRAMVAFSGEVIDKAASDFPFTERNMNPALKGRDMRKAFDTGDFQVMIAANKFQTGFDQPKLCAMYVLKKLSGVDCVQTLSRLNRTFPGKREGGTFILDLINDPQDILDAFKH
jgi:type I site-specific restriction-modification system R (restriction) subunit